MADHGSELRFPCLSHLTTRQNRQTFGKQVQFFTHYMLNDRQHYSDHYPCAEHIMKQLEMSLPMALMATALILINSGCGKQSSAPAESKPVAIQAAAPINADVLSLVEFKIAKNQAGKSVLKGSVSNSSSQAIVHATAEFKLLDKDGKEIGTAMPSVDNLGAKFSWNFEVEITPEDAASAKFSGFTTK